MKNLKLKWITHDGGHLEMLTYLPCMQVFVLEKLYIFVEHSMVIWSMHIAQWQALSEAHCHLLGHLLFSVGSYWVLYLVLYKICNNILSHCCFNTCPSPPPFSDSCDVCSALSVTSSSLASTCKQKHNMCLPGSGLVYLTYSPPWLYVCGDALPTVPQPYSESAESTAPRRLLIGF